MCAPPAPSNKTGIPDQAWPDKPMLIYPLDFRYHYGNNQPARTQCFVCSHPSIALYTPAYRNRIGYPLCDHHLLLQHHNQQRQ